MLRRSLLVLSLILAAFSIEAVSSSVARAAPPEKAKAVINGVVKDSETDQPIEHAIVILQCTCLPAQQERMTNARGIYSFKNLPAGNYTIQVLAEKANVSKIVQMPRGAKFRANFAIDPDDRDPQVIVVEAAPVSNSAGSMTIGMEEAKALPVGSNTSRDFTAVVDLGPTASRDSAAPGRGSISGLEVGPAKPVDPAAPITSEQRQIIYTAGLQVSVYDLDAAIGFAESLPDRWGGWIESRYDYQITLRLPAERLFEAITELSELGIVLGKTLQADDVTAEYVDLAARIFVLEQIVARLEQLLKRATSVEQALEIRVELDSARLELESARAQMRQLSESIDFSTLTVWLSLRGPVNPVPSSNDPFLWVDELGLELTEYR